LIQGIITFKKIKSSVANHLVFLLAIFGLAAPFFFQFLYKRNGVAQKFGVCLYQYVSLEISERPLAFSGILFCFLLRAKVSENLLNAKDIPIKLNKNLK
jgi:hypothetical protein